MRETMVRAAWVASWLWLAGPGASAQSFEERREELYETLLTELDDFASWADDRKLYLARNDAFEAVLELDPENARARKGLKYKRKRGDDDEFVWEAPKRPPSVRNQGKKDLPEMEERWSTLSGGHRERVVAVLGELDLSPHYGSGEELSRSCLWLNDDDEEIRALRQETFDGDAWVLTETLRARQRRGELRAFKDQALGVSAGQVESTEVTPEEAALGVSMRAVATPALRVLGSCDTEELRQAAVANHAVGEFFRLIFSAETQHWDAMTVYLLASEMDRDVFLNNYPGMTPDEREFRRGLVSAGFPRSPDVGAWDAERLRRLDSTVRHTMGSFFLQAFQISTDRGWVWEGFGMYLTRSLIGTRLTWYITGPGTANPADQKLRSLLMGSQANWMNESYKLIEKGEAPPLAAMLQKGVDTMEVRDTLMSYALASYLLEGWADQVGPLLGKIGAGAPADEAFRETLGLDLEAVDARLARWIGERR